MVEFGFELAATAGGARAGVFRTPHGTVETPAFMPVGTLGSVKALDPDDLRAMHAEIVLANAYHLHLRPGDALVKALGALPLRERVARVSFSPSVDLRHLSAAA